MKKLIIVLLFILPACGSSHFIKIDHNIPTAEIKAIYNPILERGFCLRHDGTIYNVFHGIPWGVQMPLCGKGDIVTHTHPFFAEGGPSITDWEVWEKYVEIYGDYRFGVYNRGKLHIYERKDDD